MKKFLGIVLVLFFIVPMVFAEEVGVNDQGEVRVVVVENLPATWRKLTKEEKMAYKNPGVEVPVKIVGREVERVDFFHYVLTEKYEQVVVFSGGKLNTIEKAGQIKGDEKVAWYVVLLLMAALFMAISNIAAMRKNSEDVTFFVAVAAFVAFVAVATAFVFATLSLAAFDVTFATFAVAGFAVFAAFAVAVVFAFGAFIAVAFDSAIARSKAYIAYEIIYYVAVITALTM